MPYYYSHASYSYPPLLPTLAMPQMPQFPPALSYNATLPYKHPSVHGPSAYHIPNCTLDDVIMVKLALLPKAPNPHISGNILNLFGINLALPAAS